MNRIVVIEDDPAIRRGLADNLRKQSYDVLTASDGVDGYRMVRDNAPDLVILDLMLPGMNEGVSLAADSSKLVTLQVSTALSLWTTPKAEPGNARQIESRTGKDDGLAGVAWTPDGRIVYTSTDGGMSDLWIMNSDGSNRKPLLTGQGRNLSPAVSPDGRYVVFVSNRAGAYGLWRMNLASGDLLYLTAVVVQTYPRFSPDGKWIVYHSDTAMNDPSIANNPPSLWRIGVDGGSPERLSHRHSRNGTVSPDGTLVAYTYPTQGAGLRVDIMSVDGGNPIKTFGVTNFQVHWTPDGRALSFVKTEHGVSNIWNQPLDGGPAVPVTDFQSDQVAHFEWSRDGRLVISRGTTIRDVVLISNFR